MITQGVLWSGGSPRPGEFPDSGRFHYPIEMECFVYNWRILLGGAASAAILTVGIAAPAFAQSAPRADSPTSSLTGVTQDLGGSCASGILCGLPSLPLAGISAASGV